MHVAAHLDVDVVALETDDQVPTPTGSLHDDRGDEAGPSGEDRIHRPRGIRTRSELVAELRRDGATWADIGNALGVTRQAAWHKCGREAPERSLR